MPTLIPASTPLPDGPRPAEAALGATAPLPHAPVAAPVSASRAGRPAPAQSRGQGKARIGKAHVAKGAITAAERQELGMVAKQAWEACGAKAAGIDANEWRHEQVAIATQGKAARVGEVTRGQFRDVLAHFLLIKGDTARAFRTAQRAGQDMADRDLALFKIREACESAGLDYPAYPDSICRRQFKVPLDSPEDLLETGRLWFLFYTVTRRAREKNKKASLVDSEGGIEKTAVVTPGDAPDAREALGEDGETLSGL